MIEKIEALITKAEDLENINPKDALELAKEAYEIAQVENLSTEMARSLIRMGRCLWLIGSFHEAVKILNKALEISKTLENSVYEVEVLKALGNVHTYMEIYDNAINYYAKALKIVKKDKLIEIEPSILNNIGGIYLNLDDLDASIDYFLESIEKNQQLGDKLGEAVTTFNLGEVYFKKEDYEKAKEYIIQSLKLSDEVNDKIGYRHSTYLLGLIEKQNKNNPKAYEFFKDSLRVAEETSDYYGEVEILTEISQTILDEGRLQEAIEYLHKALSVSQNIDGNPFAPTIYSYLAQAYDQMGNNEKTMEYYKRFHDATNNENIMRREEKLRSISFQLELEQSQQETETYRELMRELEKTYSRIKVVSEIGQSITATLELRKVFNIIYEYISKIMKSTVLGVGLYNKDENCIEFKLIKEKGEDMPPFKTSLTNDNRLAVWAFKNKKEIIINDIENEQSKYISGPGEGSGIEMHSVIFYPLIVEDMIIGVVTVQSENKNAYDKNELDTLKILVSYISIAINNAQKSERLAEEIKIKEITQQELEVLNKKLLRLSDVDGLTNIPNRRCFDNTFEVEWNNALITKTPISILVLDVDKFKEYNDNYGHLEGDRVLQLIAKEIESVTRKNSDFTARYGGDEFVALLKNSNKEQTREIARRINEKIKDLAIRHDYSTVKGIITLSIGGATIIPEEGMNREKLINKADEALYIAKGRGRNSEEVNEL